MLMAKRTSKNPQLCDREYREIISELVFTAGYVVRTERVGMPGCPEVTRRSAYTPNGEYIGDVATARRLIVKRGIAPQLRTPTSGVCSIGYNRRERKWYGWSHRAIFGFRVGSVVKQGDCVADTLPVGFRAKTLGDAKRMAEAFAESVS
jgi:hypothetical protein